MGTQETVYYGTLGIIWHCFGVLQLTILGYFKKETKVCPPRLYFSVWHLSFISMLGHTKKFFLDLAH